MQPILIISFDRLGEDNFFTKSQLITTSLANNVNFPLPWAINTVPPATLTAQFNSYESAYGAASGGDTVKIGLRLAARNLLTASLKRNAPYLELVANGSVPILESTGYDLRHDSTPPITPHDLPAPDGFKVVRGTLSGTLVWSCDAEQGAGSYVAQICTGDPTVEANWSDAGVFKNATHNTIPGLTPGQLTSVRLCGIGANGRGAWTSAISIMVV
jgi:hypothetical protein